MDEPVPGIATPAGEVNQVKEQRLIELRNAIDSPVRDSPINKSEEVIKMLLRGLVAGRPLVIRDKTAVRLEKKAMGRTNDAEKARLEIAAVGYMPEAHHVIIKEDAVGSTGLHENRHQFPERIRIMSDIFLLQTRKEIEHRTVQTIRPMVCADIGLQTSQRDIQDFVPTDCRKELERIKTIVPIILPSLAVTQVNGPPCRLLDHR